jgi:hypothetical protein
MRSVGDAAEDTFALLLATWTVADSRRFLRGLGYSHVIVREATAPPSYYLFSRAEAIRLLDDAVPDLPLTAALALHRDKATASVDCSVPLKGAPKRAVVLRQGELIGFLDLTRPSPGTPTRHAEQGLYPALDAPDRVASGTEFDLHVGFRAVADPRVTHSGKMVFTGVQPTEKCLVVLVADGLELDRMHDELEYPFEGRATFHCRAPLTDGMAVVTAQYFFRNHLAGIGRRRISIGAGGAQAEPSLVPPSPMGFPGPDEPVDMTVTVHNLNDGRLQWSWTAPRPGIQTEEPIFSDQPLRDAARFAADLVSDLETQDFTGVWAARILENKGQTVARYIPDEFLADLRRVHGAVGRPPTLLLITNDVYVPWELAWVGKAFDEVAPGFLAAQTYMGRWLSDPDVAQTPAATVEVRELTAVAAEYTKDSQREPLKEALAERACLVGRWHFVPVEADLEKLQPYVCGVSKDGHLIHFAVHGLSDPTANKQVLILRDGSQLPASALAGRHDPKSPPRFSFVFLNACQVGMAGAEFCQAAGFPGLLLRAGVHGFIAPLWMIDDGLARGIAERFYEATLQASSPVGHALRKERAQYQPEHSTTALAYVYYGNPSLRLRDTRPIA